MFLLVILYLAFIVLMIAAAWQINTKAGQPGWACLIPIYGNIVQLKIVGKPNWWIIMYFIPIVNIIFLIWTINMLSKSFGKDEGFTAGLIFLPFIFYPILGLGSTPYVGPYGDPQAFEAARNPHFDFEQKPQS